MPVQALYGRSDACARITALLDAARAGTSGALVIRGAPGTGKTALSHWAAAQADGMTVVSARGVQSESELTFAGLSELLRPLMDHIGEIPALQAAALSGALALTPATPARPFVTNAATLSLITAGAHDRPLLAIIDDAQWLDTPSLEALTFTARRVEADNVAMIFSTVDPGGPSALETAGLPELRLGGLSDRDARSLLRSAQPDLHPQVAAHLVAATAGNPLALLEIAHVLDPAQRSGQAPIDDPVPLGPRLDRLFHQRVEALPARTQQALLVAAAATTPLLAELVPAMAEIGVSAADLEPAEQAGLIRLDPDELEFHHPLLRSAVYHGAPGNQRRVAHLALAQVVDDDRRAWHLAAATIGPDESVAHALEAAGRNARHRGGFATAAAAFERAAAHSASPEARARRLLQAARDHELAGHLAAAATALTDAGDLTDDPLIRADIQLLLARIGMWSGNVRNAYELLLKEAEAVRPRDPARAVLMYAEAVMACYMSGHVRDGAAAAACARELATPLGGHVETMGILVSAHSQVLRGDAATGHPQLLRVLDRVDEAVPLPLQQWFGFAGQCLTWTEDFGRARALFDRMIAEARHHSALGRLAYALMIRADLDFRTGNWNHAYADAAESMRLARELDQVGLSGAASAVMALIAAARGREDECRECAARTVAIGTRFGFASLEVYAGAALGNLELALGQAERAIAHLEPVAELVGDLGLGEPATVMWKPDLVEAYLRTGRDREARRALDEFAEQAERTGRTWAQAATQRCMGMLTGVADRDDAFEQALRLHGKATMPFERARTQLCYGEQLRRANRRVAARAQLHDAAATFTALGAAPWLERARNELRASGARTARRGETSGVEALTPQELQVALAVAEGLSNKEAAAALFLSPKTVEFHLSNAYRKLGVRSRTQLAEHLSRHALQPSDA